MGFRDFENSQISGRFISSYIIPKQSLYKVLLVLAVFRF